MGHNKKTMIVEAKVLYELQRGSYEELLQGLDRAVAENQELFGDSDAVLFASYPRHAIVANEDGQFFKVGFKNNDGVIELGEASPVDVNVLSEDEVVSKGVDSFFEGGSMADSLRGMVRSTKTVSESPLAKMESRLAVLFAGGQIWRTYIGENRERIGAFAWDAGYGSLKIDVRPVFNAMLEDGDPDEDMREPVREELMNLERRLHRHLSEVKADFERYQENTADMRDDEADETMARFEAFAADYIDHLTEIADFMSSAVRESNEGCIACAAFVHDEVAKRFKELDLGGRFVRKVSAQFSQ
jgi:hypothetical protein